MFIIKKRNWTHQRSAIFILLSIKILISTNELRNLMSRNIILNNFFSKLLVCLYLIKQKHHVISIMLQTATNYSYSSCKLGLGKYIQNVPEATIVLPPLFLGQQDSSFLIKHLYVLNFSIHGCLACDVKSGYSDLREKLWIEYSHKVFVIKGWWVHWPPILK